MRPVIYQLFVRHFSNFTEGGQPGGTREQNGCGTFAAVNEAALSALARMGVTHLWLTGVLRHATQSAFPGVPADPACVVKGLAGSPYAVTDYFDVAPELAEEPAARLEEFRALLQRVRKYGMVPLIDFIPNHVSRCYASTVRPELSFGCGDDAGCFFSRDNAFFYLEPHHSDTRLQLPEGEFEPERGRGRVTGNNAATWTPSPYDWYETVKLNYGADYRYGPAAADALPREFTPAQMVPRTWKLMDEVLAWWQEMGVGGFRCDMAHMVPMPFWHWALANARMRDESVYFMAEAYNDHMKLTERDAHAALLTAGFNAVYDSASYRALKELYEGSAWANDLDSQNRAEAILTHRGVRYLENHDEPRLAAPAHWGGKGEAAARALLVAQFATTCSPVLFYNGQEVGERADGPGGYGGDNGRTSIFDYTTLPRLQHWTNGGRYDGALLTPEEASLRDFCTAFLPLMQHPALSKGGFYGLNWANNETPDYGRAEGESTSGHFLYAFLRHNRKARSTVLAVCNFSTTATFSTHIHIPEDASSWVGKKAEACIFRNLLEPTAPELHITRAQLSAPGLPVILPPGGALLLEWT